MNSIRVILFLFLLLPSLIISGQSPTGSSPSRFDYYFFLGNELKDIRDFSTVIENIPVASAKKIGRDSFLVCSFRGSYNSGECKSYDHHNQLIGHFAVPGFLAPDYRYTIELQDGDLWISKINPFSGALSGKRQLTQLGIFERYFHWQHWYKDLIVFSEGTTNYQYMLNVNTGEIINYKELVGVPDNRTYPITGRGKDIYDSSNGRFVNTDAAGDGVSFYDFERQELIADVFKPSFFFWLDNTHLMHNPTIDQGGPIEIIDMENPQHREPGMTIHQQPIVFPRTRKELSLNNRYLCSLENLLDPNRNICTITDLTTGEIKLWENDIKLLSKPLGMINDFLPFQWISGHHLIYVKQGDLLQQGTWLYNAETHQKTRITPYKAEGFTVLEKVGMVLFYANKTLYRYNLNGNQLDPLVENTRTLPLKPLRFQ